MKFFRSIVFLTAFLPILAMADNTPSDRPIPNGAYIELNGGVPFYTFDNIFGPGSISGFNGVGINTNLGYQFNPYFTLEAGYTNFFSPGIEGDGGSLNLVDLSLKGILPLGETQAFKFFIKAGPAAMLSTEGGSAALFLGAGAGYSVTQHLDINLESQFTTFGFASINLFSLGLAYHF